MAADGIFCIEGEWDDDLRKRRSVLPILELLERLGEARFIHRDVSTAAEVGRYLKRWDQRRYNNFTVLYLATHGDRGRLRWSARHWSSLSELAAELRSINTSACYVYFGACATLFDEEEVIEFVKQSGVAAALGYRKPVGWLESAAFEVALLPTIANHPGQPRSVLTRLMSAHGDLAKHLDFVVATKTRVYRARDR